MSESQLELEGIGQQKFTLSMWKKQNGIFTHKSPLYDQSHPWTCWDEMESPVDFLDKYGMDSFGYGNTEKEAIEDFCDDNDIELPFFWS